MSPMWDMIRTQYETGLGVDDIAGELGVEPAAVKSILLQCCEKYRKDTEDESGSPEISDTEYREFLEAYKHLARYGEDEHLRAKCLTRLLDEKKGRLDARHSPRHQLPSGVNNIFLLNDAIVAGRKDRIQRRINEANKIVDIQETAANA